MDNPKELNRIKAVLADKGRTNKWLAAEFEVDMNELVRIRELICYK